MQWKGRRESDNIEDRRGRGGKAGGISILGLVIAFVAWKFFGVDPQQAYQATQQIQQQTQIQSADTRQTAQTAEQKEVASFVATILANTEDTWTEVFRQQGAQYRQPLS